MKFQINNILFLDIETVPIYENWNDVPEIEQELFGLKTAFKRKEVYTPEEFYTKAGIWAEFGRIVCISVAYFKEINGQRNLRVTSYSNDDEKQLLIEFKQLLDKHFNKTKHLLCAHNGKEFDFPYIARRMLIHQISIPKKLDLFGKKPWEVPHLDTMELWRFGDYKHFTSLKLLTHILNVPSPKQDIDGGQVRDVYYKDNALDRIVEYCEKDTIAVAQLLLRYSNLPLVEDAAIVKVSNV